MRQIGYIHERRVGFGNTHLKVFPNSLDVYFPAIRQPIRLKIRPLQTAFTSPSIRANLYNWLLVLLMLMSITSFVNDNNLSHSNNSQAN